LKQEKRCFYSFLSYLLPRHFGGRNIQPKKEKCWVALVCTATRRASGIRVYLGFIPTFGTTREALLFFMSKQQPPKDSFSFCKGLEVLCFGSLLVLFCILPTETCVRTINDPSPFGLFLTSSKERKTSWYSVFSYFVERKKHKHLYSGLLEYVRRVLGARQEFRNVFWSISLCFPFFLSELCCLFHSPWGIFQVFSSTTLHLLYLLIPSLLQAILVCGNVNDPVERILSEGKPGFFLCRIARYLSWPGADWLPILLLYLPVELGVLPKFHKPLRLPWTLAMGTICLILNYDLLSSSEKTWKRAPYSWQLSTFDIEWSIAGLIVVAVFCNIIGWELGFVEWNPPKLSNWSLVSSIRWCALALTIFLSALPEEVLFRGIILNKLSNYFGETSWYWSLILSSVIFGLVHLKNPMDAFPVPNWRFVLMATVAGLSYGWVYQQTHSIVASGLTHGLTNLIWRTFLWKKSSIKK